MRAYLVLTPLLLIATPASAQFWSGTAGISGGMPARARPSIDMSRSGEGEVARIQRDIRNGRDSGQLSRREARQLRREGFQLDRLEARYARDGLSDAELAELRVRWQLLREDVAAKRSGGRK